MIGTFASTKGSQIKKNQYCDLQLPLQIYIMCPVCFIAAICKIMFFPLKE